jgi:hypothetical protein
MGLFTGIVRDLNDLLEKVAVGCRPRSDHRADG